MRLIDETQIVSAFVPIDLETGANVGGIASLAHYDHLTVVFFKAGGANPDDPVLTFEQGTDVAFGTNKSLSTIDEYWYKQGAALTAIGTFTRVTQAAGATVTLNATSAETQGLYIFEIDGTDLDITSGYSCVRVTVAKAGSAGAQLGCMIYILSGPRFAAETMPTAIA